MFSKAKKSLSSGAVAAEEEKAVGRERSYWDLPKLYKAIMGDLGNIGNKFQSVALNWAPLLPVAKDFINYLTAQFAVMSDPNNPDPTWKDFSREALSVIDKLQPILGEFSNTKSHIPQLLGYVEDLLRHLPQLIAYFDKLQWHLIAADVIPRDADLELDIRDLIMSRMKAKLPYYDLIKKYLEAAYQKFIELNGIEEFSKRSTIEKVVILCAMDEFNKGLEVLFLAMNRLSVQAGVKEGYLLSHPVFMGRSLTINQLCEQFKDFYEKALQEAKIEYPTHAIFPYQEKIVQQQQALLKDFQGESEEKKDEDSPKLKKRIDDLYIRTVADISDVIESAKAIPRNNNEKKIKTHGKFIQRFLELLQGYKTQEDLKTIIDDVKKVQEDKDYQSELNTPILDSVDTLILDMKNGIIQMRSKEMNNRLYLKARIQDLLEKLTAVAEEKAASSSKADIGYTLLKNSFAEILRQAKKINETFASRPDQSVENATGDTVAQIDKALAILDSQLALMLDQNIYAQYILSNVPEDAVSFSGAGWIVNTGAAYQEIKCSFKKYKELSVYFSKELQDSSQHTPKEHLLIFAGKSSEVAEVFSKLAASFIVVARDPFVHSILSTAGLKNLVFANPEADIVVEEKVAAIDHVIEVQPVDALEKVLKQISKIYDKAAKKLFQSEETITATVNTMYRLKDLLKAYQAVRAEDKNKIQMSSEQMAWFVLQHATVLWTILNDISLSFAALLSLSKKEFSLLIFDLNEALRELVMMFNRFEIEFNLKAGYCTETPLSNLFTPELQKSLKIDTLPPAVQQASLQSLINNIYLQLENLNYTVPVKFPFLEEVQVQQQTSHENAPAGTLKNSFTAYLTVSTENKIEQQINSEVAARNISAQENSQQFNALIDANIAKLQLERGANKIVLTALLRKLNQRGTPFVSLDRQLFKLAKDDADKNEMYLLYRSHTAQLMRQLEIQTTTRQDMVTVIDDCIEQLSQKRAQTYYFFATSRRSNIIAVIAAYQDLRQLMQRPGYKVTDFATESPQQYNLLVKHDKKLLEKLFKFSEQSIFLNKEKMVAGDVHPHPEPVLSMAKQLTSKHLQKQAIVNRISEIETPWMGDTGGRKVKLLQAVQKHMLTSTLQISLAAVYNDKNFKDDFHLLHEGKTGKMLQDLSQLTTTRQDITKHINLEIYRLKQSRYQRFWFSEQSKKVLIEDRIEACRALGRAMDKSPNHTTLEAVLATLNDKDKGILQKYESELLKKINTWETTNTCYNTVEIPPRRLRQ
jgi:hypothetical protein